MPAVPFTTDYPETVAEVWAERYRVLDSEWVWTDLTRATDFVV